MMQWRILSIDPAEGPDDIVVRVGYWYTGKGTRRPESTADFVEEHVIRNIQPHRQPVLDERGFFVDLQGAPVYPWVEVEGRWERLDPAAIPDQIRWTEDDADEQALILQPLADRAREVAALRPKGADVFPAGKRPRERKVNLQARGRRANVRGLTGHSETA